MSQLLLELGVLGIQLDDFCNNLKIFFVLGVGERERERERVEDY
jgi:hypothetical protein